jgi:hypothetical protein
MSSASGSAAGATAAACPALTFATGAGIAWLALLLPAVPLLAVWLRRPDGRAVRAIVTPPGLRASLGGLILLSTAGSNVQYLMPFFMIRFIHVPVADHGHAPALVRPGPARAGRPRRRSAGNRELFGRSNCARRVVMP